MKKLMLGAVAAAALLGGAGMLTVAGSGPETARAVTQPDKAPQQQQKQALGHAIDVREQELQRRQRWVSRGTRYRKDGQHRKAGDRAHKRMKARRRGGK